ncbi:MAG: transposase family protein [Kineosporiaceae bacterium]|nr:transposase family protein [Kineosporiaceae bacterium]
MGRHGTGVHRDRPGRPRRRRRQRRLPLPPDATDVATGWTEAISIASKGERTVSAALTRLQVRFPFALLGIHSDNGSEFINHHLLKWATDRQITFTRGRPSHSNDQAHIEQKNWTTVRHAVGYHRYDTARELSLLNELWPLQAQLTNLFLPQQKLLTKTRDGAKATKTYDKAATPPPAWPATTPTS